jgi:hypothetical protein
MVFEPAKLPRMQLHVTSSFFTSSPQNYTGVFTQPRRQKYVQGGELRMEL